MVLSTKTKYMIFSLRENQRFDYTLTYHNLCCLGLCNNDCITISRVDKFKYLGVLLDDNLSFRNHVENLKVKLQFSIRTFYFLRKKLSSNLLRSLYFALVQSRLEYCITSWGGIYFSTINQLLVAQKHLIRIILNKPRLTPSLPLFRNIPALPSRYLYIFKVVKMFYLRSGSVIYCDQHYSLRAGAKANVPKPRTENFRRCYLYIAPNLFNSLPTYMKDIDSKTVFVKHLKKWILDHDNVEYLLLAVK